MLSPLAVGPAFALGGLAILFHLSRVGSPEWVRRLGGDARPWKFNLWQIMALVVVAALLFHAISGPPDEGRVFSFLLLCLGVLIWFVRNWCNEFVFLMGLRDDDFPGRNDKLIWAIVLMAFAPISVWLFRSYRLAHWPGPKFVPVDYSPPDPEPPGRETAAMPA
ncbi:MAG: hypothetical protein ACLQGP_13965 [Isosphaeraceae bacterium]